MQIRPAATLALVRDSDRGPEILLLQRSHDAVFLPGFYVYPGGAVDDADHTLEPHIAGPSDAEISRVMNLPAGGYSYMAAAIRECFEEAGLLLAATDDGGWPDLAETELLQWREGLTSGERSLAELCRAHNLRLPLHQVAYLDHWITPPGPPRRFDTRFFIAEAPAGMQVRHDGAEIIDHIWLTPTQALADHAEGRRLFGTPTLHTLRLLQGFASVAAIMAHVRQNPPEPFPYEPWPAIKDGRPITLKPGEPAYAEARLLDPQGQGGSAAVITPGEPVSLAPGVVRLTAPNPGLMTGPGTNTYLLGDGDDLTLIDPGPAIDSHIARLLELSGGRIKRILVTHTHRDHSPAAAPLKAATGAELLGFAVPDDGFQDTSFTPDRLLQDNEVLDTGAGPLQVLHTPGHASNHACFLLPCQQMLFAGDHIMQGSTVVINPPDGDMKAYLQSLHRLSLLDLRWIAPAHGFVMGLPLAMIDYLITHRMAREFKVVDALKALGPADIPTLTDHAYSDTPKALHSLATRSLLAHLLKLEQENRAHCDDGRWRWVP